METSSGRSSRRRSLHEPELLVLDEPFAGLDPVAVQTLAEVLRGEAARGAAVLFSSHQLELVEDICEEVAIVDHGRVVATGDVEALRRQSQRRRIELQLDGAPPEWLPHVARRRARRAPQRRRCGCRGRDVDPEQVLARGGTAGPGRRVQLRPAVARGGVPGAGGAMSGRQAITLVAWREIRERLRSRAFLVSTRADARARRRRRRRSNGVLAKSRRTRRGDRAGAARARRRAATRSEAVRCEGAARPSPRRPPGESSSRRRRSTRSLLLASDRLVFRANVDSKVAAVADTRGAGAP